MPNPRPPPTPGSSSDIRGKEGAAAAPVFNLPPNAWQEAERASPSSTTPSANGSDSSYRPVSPASPADLSRKRSATQANAVVPKEEFALPPPPTRSRKIIQMKPREAEQQQSHAISTTVSVGQGAEKPQPGTQAGGKRRQNNSNTTAAGRKIARKTAHSLIERRRRSKMNEEFDVLKNMIPACKGHEMHKLAILQASIEYLRYLEQCVAELKTQSKSVQAPARSSSAKEIPQEEADDDEDDNEMEDDTNNEEDSTAVSTPSTAPRDRPGSRLSLPSLSQMTTLPMTSPATFSTGAIRHYSTSSTTQSHPSYSPYIHSNQASPAFSATNMPTPYSATREHFGLGSPAIKALDTEPTDKWRRGNENERSEREHELDQEATAALLMLNHDRRSWRGEKGGRSGNGGGMSVKDLLSG